MCESRCSYLVEIGSKLENDFIRAHLELELSKYYVLQTLQLTFHILEGY